MTQGKANDGELREAIALILAKYFPDIEHIDNAQHAGDQILATFQSLLERRVIHELKEVRKVGTGSDLANVDKAIVNRIAELSQRGGDAKKEA